MTVSDTQRSLKVLRAQLLLLGCRPVPCFVVNVSQHGIDLVLDGASSSLAELAPQASRPGAAAAILIQQDGHSPWQVPAILARVQKDPL